VLELAATYSQVKSVVTDVLGGSDPDVFGGTAIRTYHLEIM
jgi:L-fuconolactonase